MKIKRKPRLSKSFHLANVIDIITYMNEMTDKEIKDSFKKVLKMKQIKIKSGWNLVRGKTGKFEYYNVDTKEYLSEENFKKKFNLEV